jgi:transcriptional regulator with XRE-family HTH domain
LVTFYLPKVSILGTIRVMKDTRIQLDVERLREVIEAQGRTRKWIAEQCGITPAYLTRILCGFRMPGKPLLKLLAQKLEIPEEELLEHKGKAS